MFPEMTIGVSDPARCIFTLLSETLVEHEKLSDIH